MQTSRSMVGVAKVFYFILFFLITNVSVLFSFYLIQVSDAQAWDNIENRRRFFESYAKENEFDSNSAKAWMLQAKKKVLEVKVNRY